MARKARIEVEGGLYHVITRGNDRRDIFHCEQDHQKFLALLRTQKERLPFFLYAFCLMTNHVHLLIERRTDAIGRIMHRVLTGYSQYYNRKYKKAGHLLQGRHKSILCQSEVYLGELVRYIHLNPVRAKMVVRVEDYPYSSHRAYLDLEPAGIVDVDPVLRPFGPRRHLARQRFAQYVALGIDHGHRADFYLSEDGILGSEEFVDATIHRIGDSGHAVRPTDGRLAPTPPDVDLEQLVAAVEQVFDMPRSEFCSPVKAPRPVAAKEALVVSARKLGVSVASIAKLTGLNTSNISRRHDVAINKMSENSEYNKLIATVIKECQKESHKSQA